MQMNDYQKAAMRTANHEKMSSVDMLTNSALGMNGEAGEFADLIKKSFYQGHALDAAELEKEVGDVLWYCALAATAIGTPLDEIAQKNIDKLKARYPDRFDAERSRNRNEANEG